MGGIVEVQALVSASADRGEIMSMDIEYAGRRRAVESTEWPAPTTPAPDDDDMEAMIMDGTMEATDGCLVDPDGVCEHDYPSWLLYCDLI